MLKEYFRWTRAFAGPLTCLWRYAAAGRVALAAQFLSI